VETPFSACASFQQASVTGDDCMHCLESVFWWHDDKQAIVAPLSTGSEPV